ncbi:MAG: type I restriction enzyme HsdR N-terminal domain-containing protein [Candidatus Cloacimonetes bacterium]|nr:type I restriction enzyme HsdR N-terminal domain-containing protein [Candidatus Cloacimonadota bacterium]
MDFKDQIRQLCDRVIKLKDQIQTEEATKHSLVMPFIQALGYDVFNPCEVVPEYTCDIGTKKGEKIDYAIFKDNQPIMLIECKHWAANLTLHDNQLLRYFHVSKAKFGILTNGLTYKFYTDLEATNKMDEKPFLDIDLTDLKDNMIEELKKFHKSYFDIDTIINTATELKYTYELKNLINKEIVNPSEFMVKHFAKQVYSSIITAKVLEQFTALVKQSFSQVIGEYITNTFKTALNKEADVIDKADESTPEIVDEHKRVVTSAEEMEGFFIVKSILRQKIDSNRIFHRDTMSYFGILLDDSNRKPICRLMLDKEKKYIVLFDDVKERKEQIIALDDIYLHSDALIKTIDKY